MTQSQAPSRQVCCAGIRGWPEPGLCSERACVGVGCARSPPCAAWLLLPPRAASKANWNPTNSWLLRRQPHACPSGCTLWKIEKRGKKASHKKQESPQRLVAGITLFTPVTTDVLSRSKVELREASLKQMPCERSSMKEQQALEGGQECPQEHEQQLAS